jgi:hypothetical protein
MVKQPNKFIAMIAGDGVEDEVREFADKQNIDLDKLEKCHTKHFATKKKRDETAKMVEERAESGDLGPVMIMAMNQQKIVAVAEHGQRIKARRDHEERMNFIERGAK